MRNLLIKYLVERRRRQEIKQYLENLTDYGLIDRILAGSKIEVVRMSQWPSKR